LLPADQVFKAIGQALECGQSQAVTEDMPATKDGKVAVNADGETSLSGVWAGGDCIAGVDLTVQAVQDGKLAAHAIDRRLRVG
jgi:glutamate synthase (NADPH/NADH) small chain